MYTSKLFAPMLKENPSDALISSHRLLLRGGFIRQLTSGIYNILPLGLRVIRNIDQVIHEEMEKIGGQELLMPCIQPASLWQESERYDAYGKEMLRITDRHGREMLFGPTHEEVVSDLFRHNVKSYKSLPLLLYQIQWKFRDEIRPRFGLMRGREFYMKDGYSFDIDKESSIECYKRIFAAYIRIFRKLGLKAIPMKADNGSIGGDFSHEFHIVAKNGESVIFYDKKLESLEDDNFDNVMSYYAAVEEMHNEEEAKGVELVRGAGIEVGHIFYFGTKYSSAFNINITDKDGKNIVPHMGSYGIGVSRLLGAIIEASHDDDGIIWPMRVAPFKVGIICANNTDEQQKNAADKLYSVLLNNGIEPLYDNEDTSVGVKISKMKLIGIPRYVIVGKKLAEGKLEIYNRESGETQYVDAGNAPKVLIDDIKAALGSKETI